MSLTAEQIEERKAGVGCSELLAALGKDTRCSRLELYKRKIGELPDLDLSDNERVIVGEYMEPAIRELFQLKLGCKIAKSGETLRHASAPLLGHPDGLIEAMDCGIEFKNRDRWIAEEEYGAEGTDQVPLRDLVQCVGYMELTGLKRWLVGVFVGGNERWLYEVGYDDELVQAIVAGVHEFWSHVDERRDPDPMTPEDVKLRWPKHLQPSITATDEIIELVDKHAEMKATLKVANQREAELKAEIQKYMADSADLLAPDNETLATWRSARAPKKFDEKRFASDNPVLYREYFIEQPGSRRFLNKRIKQYEVSQ